MIPPPNTDPNLNWLSMVRGFFYKRMIQPFINTTASPQQVAWGAAIGVFVAFTPTVGIQIYITLALWAFLRYTVKRRFSLPIALVMVFISNPVTVGPLYYASFVVGRWFLSWVGGGGGEPFVYEAWKLQFYHLISTESDTTMLWAVLNGLQALWEAFGWPLFVGGTLFSILFSALTYPAILWVARRLAKMTPTQMLKANAQIGRGC